MPTMAFLRRTKATTEAMTMMPTMTTAIKAADAGIEFSAVDASVRQKMD